MDPVGLDLHALRGLDDRHLGVLFEQLGQHAHMVRVEMRNQDEARAAVGRHIGEQPIKGFEPAGRCADGDD